MATFDNKNFQIWNGLSTKNAQINSDFGLKLALKNGKIVVDSSANNDEQSKMAKLAEEIKKNNILGGKKGIQKSETHEMPTIWKNDEKGENGVESESEEEEELDGGEECKVTENFFRMLENQIEKEEEGGKLKKFCKTGHRILNILRAMESQKDIGEEDENKEEVPKVEEVGKRRRSMFDASKQANFFAEQKRCLKEKCLYEDPMFPADADSIFYSPIDQLEEGLNVIWPKLQWKRPGEILLHNSDSENHFSPKFISNGFQRADVVQGMLANCWMVASIANLTQHTFLFYRVVSPDQDFGEDYAGIFHFKLWRYGEWVDVVIDDRLPCYENVDGNLVLAFIKSEDPTEFWSALLEKAFAKVHGSYEALSYGHNAEALEDLTGGIVETFLLQKAPRTLVRKVQRGLELGNIYGCATTNTAAAEMASIGLVSSHAYSVTMVREIRHRGTAFPLWRLRNPHGQFEWNQAWSDGSVEWDQLPAKELRELEHECKDDGEFWMAYKDLVNHFDSIHICNIDADVLEQVTKMSGTATKTMMPRRTWQTQIAHGKWRNYRAECEGISDDVEIIYEKNPKYLLTVENHSPSKAVSNPTANGQNSRRPPNRHPVIIALMQKYRREQKYLGLEQLGMGMKIYKLHFGMPKSGLKSSFFANQKNLVARIDYTMLREAVISLNLAPGKYLIVPYTYFSMEEGEYLLRCFSTASITNELVLEEKCKLF